VVAEVSEVQTFEGQEQADRIFRANSSPRYKKLSDLEKWVEGRQYDGMPSFWSDDVPLWDRAPAIVYPVVAIARDSYVDLLLGQSRYPDFTTKQGEDESDEENGLSPDDSSIVDRFIREWHKLAQFRSCSREALASAMGVSSAALVHGVRNGKPFTDLVPAKWCEPTLDQEGAVLRMEIIYPYQEQYKDSLTKKWAVRTRIYRRVIDATRDVEYLPGDANETGSEPIWIENKARSVDHNLGFCPVVWYPFMRGCVPINVIDGKAIHENITDEIRAHDIARSQWHRGGLMSEPQMYEIGVPPGFNPTESGFTPRVLTTERGGQVSPGNPVTGAFVDQGGGKSARKRGPNYIYQYPSEVTVGALFYPGDALKAQEENCRDLRIKLQEALSVVFLDPESLKYAASTSGKALEALKQKQIDRCDKIRDDLAERMFQPSVSMQLRIARAVLAKNGRLRVPGAKKIQPILDKLTGDDGEWQAPALQVKWGDYFRPDPAEQQILVQMVVAALECSVPILTVRLAVEKLAPIFGVDNVSAFLEELQKEVDDRSAKKSADASGEIQAAISQLQKTNGSAPVPPGQTDAGQSPERPGDAAPGGAV